MDEISIKHLKSFETWTMNNKMKKIITNKIDVKFIREAGNKYYAVYHIWWRTDE